MGVRLRSWRQKIKQHWVSIGVVTAIIVIAVALILMGYRFDWTGFNGNYKTGKALWDWLQLLIIPIVLAIGGFWLNQIQKGREERATQQQAELEREITADNQREAALQAYIDKISELLLHEHLAELKPEYEGVRMIARVRTLTVLRRLDPDRKGSLLQFLQEPGLINKDKQVIALSGADLSEAHLERANLQGVDLHGTDMSEAHLERANLQGANLRDTDLSGADLRRASLLSADLSASTLSEAHLEGADLRRAALLTAVMRKADLRDADMSEARLRSANLSQTNLSQTNLGGATLLQADLSGANLSGANLSGAYLKAVIGITIEELEKKAKSLQGATMPDGSIHA